MDVALLNEELEQNVVRRQRIRDQHAGPTMPADAKSEFETLTKRSEALINLIEVEKQKVYDKQLDEQKAYLDEPVYKTPRSMAFDGDSADTKQLLSAGWEVKGGMITRRTSFGMEVPMYGEEVLRGPLPDDQERKEYFLKTRHVFQPEYRDAWIKWLNSPFIKMGGMAAFSQLSNAEQKALSEGLDPNGGYTVPPDIQAEIGGRRAQVSIMRQLATVRQTNRDVWQQPMYAPASSTNRNIFSDGFIADWVGETPTQSDIDPSFEMFIINIRKLRAKTTLSNDLIADSVGNLLSDLSARGGRSLGLKEDQGFIAGAGGSLEPLGILNHNLALTATSSDGMAYDVEGSSSNAISNSVSDAGSAPKIKAMTYTLPSQYAGNASWIMRRGIQGDIAALVDANGRPFWNSYLESGFGRPQMVIEGAPVFNSEFVGTDGNISTTAATIPLIYGDISAYHIIERSQLSVRILNERYADTDQTGLILFSRVGGGLWNYDAIRTGIIAA
jgi:HK97 family phage major capsid protein